MVRLGFSALAGVCLVGAVTSAEAGPCAAQIIARRKPSPPRGDGPGHRSNRSRRLSVLSFTTSQRPVRCKAPQPKLKPMAKAALDRARKADAAGDAKACAKALDEAKAVYGL